MTSVLHRILRGLCAVLFLALSGGVLPVLLPGAAQAQVAVPSFSALFSPDAITSGNNSTLTFTITENSASPVSDLAFSAYLPMGVYVATGTQSDTCGGTLTATAGDGSITYSGGRVGALLSCTISVPVTSSTITTYTFTTGDLTSSLGNSGSATDDLTVSAAVPELIKSFSPSTVNPGDISTLTYTIDNSASALNTFYSSFNETLPAGMEIATPPSLSNSCGGTVNVTSGGSSIGVQTTALNAGASCSFSFDVKALSLGEHVTTTSLYTQFSNFSNSTVTGTATLSVEAPPVSDIAFSKSFAVTEANAGTSVTLTFDLENTNRDDTATDIAFTDDLNAMLTGLTATALPADGFCGVGSTLTGSSSLTLSGASLASGASCSFDVTLLIPAGATSGTYTNTTGTLTADIGGNPYTGTTASANLRVLGDGSQSMAFSKAFIDDPVAPGGTVTLRYTVTNPNSAQTASAITFSDRISDITGANNITIITLPAANSCGAGSTFFTTVPDTDVFAMTMSGGTLAAGDSCSFDLILAVAVGSAPGGYSSTSGELTATVSGTTVTTLGVSDTLTIAGGANLSFTKEFDTSVAGSGETVGLTFTLTSAAESTATVSNLTFTDDLTSFLPGTSFASLTSDSCGGTLTGTTTLSYSGGSLAPGNSCAIVVDVTLGTGSGIIETNNTSTLVATATTAGDTTAPATSATLRVINAQPLQTSKEFIPATALPGESITLRYTLTNPDPTFDYTAGFFTDNLSTTLSGLTTSGALPTEPCGAGSSITGPTFLIASGLIIPAGTSCSFDLTLAVPAGAADGNYSSTSSSVSATVNGNNTALPALAATLAVDAGQLSLSKSFTDDPVTGGDTVTLEYTLTNLNSSFAASALAFTDDLDAALSGLVATGLPTSVCNGGTLAGTSNLSLSGASLAAGASCTFSVSLTVPGGASANTYNSTSSAVSGTMNGLSVTGNSASDTLSINAFSLPSFSKSLTDTALAAGGSTTLTYVITNTDGSATLSGLRFSDDLDAVLSGLAVSAGTGSNLCGSGSVVSGTSTVLLESGTLGPGESCSIPLTVTVPANAAVGNYTSTSSTLREDGTQVANAASASFSVEPAPSFAKAFADASIVQGDVSTLTFSIDNSASAIAASSLDFTDNLPAGMKVAPTPNASSTCTGGTLTATAGAGTLSYTGGTVAAGASCSISVDMRVNQAGNFINTTGDLTSSSGNSGTATDSLTATAAPIPGFSKAFADASIVLGDVSTLTLTIDNTTALIRATALDVTDTLPAGLVVAPTPNASTTCNGGTLTATAGAGSLGYTGGIVPIGSSCTISVDLRATLTGSLINTTGDLTSSLGNSGTASDTLTVTAAPIPGFAKSFATDSVTLGDSLTLTFSIDNSTALIEASALDFTDTLPAGLVVAAAPNASTTCTGGTLTAAGGSSSISYSGGTIAASSSCSLTVDVTASGSGTLVNTSGDLTSSLGNSGTASDSLKVPTLTLDSPVAGDDTVNAAEAPSVTISGSTTLIEDGQSVSVMVTDSASGTASGTASISGNAWSLSLDLSGLADGALTIAATVDDLAATASAEASASVTKDATAPSGHSVSLDQDPVNSSNDTAASFTFAGAEVGASYSYTISSDGGGVNVTGTGTIATASDQITSLDLSGLGDGILTLSVVLTDSNNNAAPAVTDTASKDSTAPTIAFDSPLAGDDQVNAAEAGSVTLSGATTGLSDGRSVAVVVTDSASGTASGTATTSGNAWSLTLDLSGLADGALSLTADVSDASGNPAPQATASLSKDSDVPSGYSASFDQDPVNSSNDTAVSFTFAGAEVGTTYSYTISSDGGGADVTGTGTIATASDQISGLDLSGLGSGTLTLSVVLSDAPGNTGSPATDSATKDSIAPGLAFDSPLAGDDQVNAAEVGSVTLSGTTADLSDGRTVTVVVTDSASATVSGTASTSGNAWSLTLDLSGLADGALSLTADVSDASGNPAPQASASLTKDVLTPTGYSVAFDQDPLNASLAASASFTFAGGEAGTSYSYTISSDGGGTDVTGSGTLATATDQITGLDLSGLGDGTLTLSVVLSDAAGNAGSPATDSATKDSTLPSIAFDSPLAGDDLVSATEAGSTPLSGATTNLDDGRTVTVVVTDSASATVSGTASTSGNAWSLNLNLSGLADGALSLTADVSDASGNPAPQATASLTKDVLTPNGYSVAFDQDPLNATNVDAVSFTFADGEIGASYSYTISSDGGGTDVTGSGTLATATDQITGLDLSDLRDGTLTLSVVLSDAAGNAGSPATDTADKDADVPSLAFDSPLAGDDQVSGSEAGSVTLSGTSIDLTDGREVTVVVTDSASATVSGTATINGAAWSLDLDLSDLADGALSLTADATDASSNPATQATASLTKDTTAPSGYSVAFDQDPVTAASQASASFTFSGAEVGASYSYKIRSSAGTRKVTGSGIISAAGQQISGIDLSRLRDGDLTLTVRLTDTLGNRGAKAQDTTTLDATQPSASLSGPDTAQSDPFSVDLTFSEAVTGLALSALEIDNGTASDLTGSGDSYSFTVTPDHDGTVAIALPAGAAQDGSGNDNTAAAAIEVTAALTGTPDPNPPVDNDGDGIPDNLESASADRDGDGIPDAQDYDPQGYFYCEDDGRILSGGGITVTGPSGSNSSVGIANDINIVRDGSSGEYQWFAQRPGTYTVTYHYPTAGIASTARPSSGSLDVTTLLPANPAVIGSTEFGSTGVLADGSLAANPAFYDTFVIEAGDPNVLANNIPMTQCAPNPVTVSAVDNGGEANGAATDSVIFTVAQGRISTQDTVLSYSLGGTATSGSDYSALSGSVTIAAGTTEATVEATVLEDVLIEGTETLTLTLTGLVSTDPATVLSITASDLTGSADITDDDFAVVAVSNDDLVASENGTDTAAMSFHLMGQPSNPVVLTFAGDSQCTVSPATLSFSAGNFATAQTLTISAIDDEAVEGNHSCQPSVTVTSTDSRYDGFALTLARVQVLDDLVDQIRDRLTEVLKNDLEETVKTQQRYFSSLSKGALDRLKAGQEDLGCGTLSSFDVDGTLQVTGGDGQSDGSFGYDVYNCYSGSREILDGRFTISHSDDLGTQAILQFANQKERFVSETDLRGRFWGGYLSRTNVDGQADGSINGFGVNAGLYGARQLGDGLFLDYYAAGGLGHHRYKLSFAAVPSVIEARGSYDYAAAFAGAALSGQREYETFTLSPRVGIDLAYAVASDADVTATQLAQTDTGRIDIPDYNGGRIFAELEFSGLGNGTGEDQFTALTRTAFAPRFACEASSFDSDLGCGFGFSFSRELINATTGVTFGFEVDYEHIDDTGRLTLDISRERRFANGQGAVVTRLLAPSADDLRLEHGIQLDF